MRKEILSKRERVERTLNFLPVDRVAIHDEIYNPEVISLYTGKKIEGFNYSLEDKCEVVRKTMDMWRCPDVISGTRMTEKDGFVFQSSQDWTGWVVKRPFNDTRNLKEYILKDIEKINKDIEKFNIEKERENHHKRLLFYKKLIDDDTVIMIFDYIPLRDCVWRVGIDLFTYLYWDEPGIIETWLQTLLEYQLKVIKAAADNKLSPVVLIANEIASTKAPLFNPDFLRRNLFPAGTRLTNAWHEHNIKVLMEIQGNCKTLIDDFLKCGTDGFYAIEPTAGMDIVELKKKYPKAIWACGINGVNLMTFGSPGEVREEVRRQIEETDALNTGGLFLGTSSEINPPIKPENYRAMIEETRSIRNKNFS